MAKSIVCQCSAPYTWYQKTNACGSKCGEQTCDEKRSEGCDKSSGAPFCRCRPAYMGPSCAQPRNACVENYYSTKAKGNAFCGLIKQCVPKLGSNVYRCDCPVGGQCIQNTAAVASSDASVDGEDKVNEKKGGSNTAVIVITCLLVSLVLAGGGGYMYSKRQKPNSAMKNPTEKLALMQDPGASGKPNDKPSEPVNPATQGSASSLRAVTSQVLAESASAMGITSAPSAVTSKNRSVAPSTAPSNVGSVAPSAAPSNVGSVAPFTAPSNVGSVAPSTVPSNVGSVAPSVVPSDNRSLAASSVLSNDRPVAPSAVPSYYSSN